MSAASRPGRYMSIGEVLGQLRPEFPDVTISKIRFLESEGLVEPQRTPSGYRKFTHDDVERLRYVLAAQRDHYLPLKVIREHLDAHRPRPASRRTRPARGPRVPMSRRGRATGCPTRRVASRRDASELRLSRAELLEAAGLDEDAARASSRATGCVGTRPGAAHYDGDALVVAKTVAEMAAFGLEPRHLRAFRTAADREVGLVEQVVAPLRDAAQRRGRGAGRRGRPRAGGAVGAAARRAGQGRAGPRLGRRPALAGSSRA